MGDTSRTKRIASLVIGIIMVLSGMIFVRGLILLASDVSRPDVDRTETLISLLVVVLLAAVCFFEGYRFLSYFRRTKLFLRLYPSGKR